MAKLGPPFGHLSFKTRHQAATGGARVVKGAKSWTTSFGVSHFKHTVWRIHFASGLWELYGPFNNLESGCKYAQSFATNHAGGSLGGDDGDDSRSGSKHPGRCKGMEKGLWKVPFSNHNQDLQWRPFFFLFRVGLPLKPTTN